MIWIDASLDIANKRLLKRDGNKAKLRINSPTQNSDYVALAREHADYIFKPSNHLTKDVSNFNLLVKSALEKTRQADKSH